jgi:hypothetical protein
VLTLRLERTAVADRGPFAGWIDPAAIARWPIHAGNVEWVSVPEVDARPPADVASTWPAQLANALDAHRRGWERCFDGMAALMRGAAASAARHNLILPSHGSNEDARCTAKETP